MIAIVTVQGDQLDALLAEHYGAHRLSDALAAVLADPRNLELARHGPVLPGGLRIVLPEIPPAAPPGAELWQ